MYFSYERGFEAIAVGSESVAIAMNSLGHVYTQFFVKPSGQRWHRLNNLPGNVKPIHIDCAADGTIGAAAEDGNIYLYDRGPRDTNGEWKMTDAALDGATASSISIGSINNILILTNEGTVYRYYANGLSKKIYNPQYFPSSSYAYVVGTATDGTSVARFSESTGTNKQDIHQYFEAAGWANITPGDHDDIYSLSPSDANTIYFACGEKGLYKATGNGIIADVPVKEAWYNSKLFKYQQVYLEGNIISVNAGTDNRVAIVFQNSDGSRHAFLSTPDPAYGHLMPEMDVPEHRVVPVDKRDSE